MSLEKQTPLAQICNASIPAQKRDANVTYYVEAFDEAGNNGTANNFL
jgi:hypothetical protein